MICRHCHENKANRPRGLCWRCYYTPGITELYPSESKFCPRPGGSPTLPGRCVVCKTRKSPKGGACSRCAAQIEAEEKSHGTMAEYEARLEAERSKSPLWAPSDLPSDSAEYCELVRMRERAGLPARHPGDRQPDLR